MYKAEILADSLNPQGDRITTMKITFPRIMLAEFNTHRMFSRNSASSRAIPFKKMVKMVEENPFIPIAWQKDHKGMQGTEYFNNTEYSFLEKENREDEYGSDQHYLRSNWLSARNNAINIANFLNKCGATKQLCNRLLEPFMWHTVIVTATEWSNFFELRCPRYNSGKNGSTQYFSKKDYCKDLGTKTEEYDEMYWWNVNDSQADIHIQAIAELMWDAYNESKPKQLQAGEWHIPFGDNIDITDNFAWDNSTGDLIEAKVKIATARCARISYETLGDNPKIDYEADIRLHDMLAQSGHWSPFEHVVRAMNDEEYLANAITINSDFNEGWCRNFKGFIQYRSLVDK